MRNEKEYPYVDVIDGVEVVYFNPDFIVGRWVETKWQRTTIRGYSEKGYKFTFYGDTFLLDVRDLQKYSTKRVLARCSFCGSIRHLQFRGLNYRVPHSKCIGCNLITNEVGNKYDRLVVTKFSHTDRHNNAHWHCLCKCGNETTVGGGDLRRKLTRSCGCLLKEFMVKLGKSRRDPNLTDEDRANKRTNQWYVFSFPIFERDNFTCQISGKHGGKLVAHHLYDYSTYPEKALDINNGITIRRRYHHEFHRWMGTTRVSCTKQDMINFCDLFYPDAPFLKSL